MSLEEGEGMGKASGRKSSAVEADSTDNKQVDQSVQKLIDNFDVTMYSFTASITMAAR